VDPAIGEFLLTRADVRLPREPQRIYSCNEALSGGFPAPVRAFLAGCKGAGAGAGAGAAPWSMRYVGSLVADAHRTLLYGGVFLYPATAAAPRGKLRLAYEAAPIAFVFELAGGRAITGRRAGAGEAGEAACGAACGAAREAACEAVLDVLPASLHERAPLLLGCARDVDALERLILA